MVQAMGPTYAGGTQPITKDGYDVLYLPDVNNHELIAQGEAPVFYYVPNRIRMARKDGPDKGDYLFNLVRFSGTGGEGVIGGGGDVAGGIMTFSVTGALPEQTRRQAEADGGGRGVAAAPGDVVDVTDGPTGVGHERVDERGRADAGDLHLPDIPAAHHG